MSCCYVSHSVSRVTFFFFNDTATTEIYTLSLHDALPICPGGQPDEDDPREGHGDAGQQPAREALAEEQDRKSTRLNSSHANISYAVFCLKKKNRQHDEGGGT